MKGKSREWMGALLTPSCISCNSMFFYHPPPPTPPPPPSDSSYSNCLPFIKLSPTFPSSISLSLSVPALPLISPSYKSVPPSDSPFSVTHVFLLSNIELSNTLQTCPNSNFAFYLPSSVSFSVACLSSRSIS